MKKLYTPVKQKDADWIYPRLYGVEVDAAAVGDAAGRPAVAGAVFILEAARVNACDRTVLATDKHRFEYAEGILKNWKQSGVKEKEDISQMDAQHQKARSKPATAPKAAAGSNKFNQFAQNTYDFATLEQELLSN